MRAPLTLLSVGVLLISALLTTWQTPIAEGESRGWQDNEVDASTWSDGPLLEGSPMDEPLAGDPVVLLTVSYTPSLGGGEVSGEVIIELFPQWVPVTAWNFINLTDEGFYDGIFFHRVIDDFVAQSGDPSCYAVGYYPLTTATCGEGGSGETIPLEHEVNMSHVDGAIGMARSLEPDSAESQFYICDGEQHQLDPENRDDEGYATFGVVRDGMSHVRAIAQVPTSNSPLGGGVVQVPPGPDRPIDEVRIISVAMLGVVGTNNSSTQQDVNVGGGEKTLSAPSLAWIFAIPAAAHKFRVRYYLRGRSPPIEQYVAVPLDQRNYCEEPLPCR